MSNGDGPQGLHRWVGVVGLFIAPTTIITSVCVYFGLVSTREFYKYFGIDSNAIGFTSGDHVTKSISVLYAPILALLIAWAALIWAAVYIRGLVAAGRHLSLIRNVGWAALGVGALAVLRGVLGVLRPVWAPISAELVTPVTLGMGTALVLVGCWLLGITRTAASEETDPRPYAAARRVSVFVAAAVMVMALFWTANIFATAYGRHDAMETVAELWEKEEGVVLDTTDRLNLPASLIVETPLGAPVGEARTAPDAPGTGTAAQPPADTRGTSNTPGAAEVPGTAGAPSAATSAEASAGAEGPVTYRYQCFRSLVVRGDQWVLVPAKWTPQFGYAVIVYDDSSNRLSVIRRQGIAETGAANWNESNKQPGGWQCPEVAPRSAYAR